MKYDEKLEKIYSLIKSREKTTIIIGDNSIGKSHLLKKIILRDKVYFIDSVNRYFNYKNALIIETSVPFLDDVIETRKKEDKFNLFDSFGNFGDISPFFNLFKDELNVLLNEFLNINICIKKYDGELSSELKLYINDNIYYELSSGYQAIIRIFLELLFLRKNNIYNEVKYVLIDEVNEYLSVKNESRILSFLRNKFSEFIFIVTTHSADIIANTKEADIIVIKKDDFEFLDSNDFDSITKVSVLFNNIFNLDGEENEEQLVNSKIRKLYNLKLNNQWNNEYDRELSNLGDKKLSNIQKRQIIRIGEM